MNREKAESIWMTAIGLTLLIAGLIALKASGFGTNAVPYLCVGLGCGVFGHGCGKMIARGTDRNHPDAARQRRIEENDERNRMLRDMAQAKAYRVMLPVFGALFIAFALMRVEVTVVLLLVAAYLFVCGCSVYYSVKYRKEY